MTLQEWWINWWNNDFDLVSVAVGVVGAIIVLIIATALHKPEERHVN